jgi:hypothetical protein
MNELTVIEHGGQRVLTTQQMAQVYETEVDNIQKNFSRNTERFCEGRDYYFLNGEELKDFKNSLPTNSQEPLKFAPQLYLWTQRGANRHCKILDTDKAWQQFDRLEETYFRVQTAQSMSQLEIMHKMLGAMVEGEKRQRELEERTEVIERRLTLVKDTLGQHDDAWRDTNNKMLNTIVKEKGGRDYQGVRSETYTLLEERAGCDLNTRLRNQRQRMEESGSPKAKINALTKMDIIESDKKLKEIYTSIVKELTIKYVV